MGDDRTPSPVAPPSPVTLETSDVSQAMSPSLTSLVEDDSSARAEDGQQAHTSGTTATCTRYASATHNSNFKDISQGGYNSEIESDEVEASKGMEECNSEKEDSEDSICQENPWPQEGNELGEQEEEMDDQEEVGRPRSEEPVDVAGTAAPLPKKRRLEHDGP